MNDLIIKFSGRRTIELDTVKFIRNEDFKSDSEYEIQMSDSIEAHTAADYLGIVVKREITCRPQGPFSIFVSYIVKHYLKDGETVDWDNINLKKFAEDNKQMLLPFEMETTSLLISQLTAAYGHIPLITPPVITE